MNKLLRKAEVTAATVGLILTAVQPTSIARLGSGMALKSSCAPAITSASETLNQIGKQKVDRVTRERAAQAYAKLPMAFELNQGQTDGQVKFISKGDGYSLFLTQKEAVLALAKPQAERGRDAEPAVIRMSVPGANTQAKLTGDGELPGRSAYFIGNDPTAWKSDVPSYRRVRCENVLPGTDLVYYGNQRQLEFDFVLAPGADTKTVELAFEGTEKLSLNDAGELVLRTSGGEMIQHRPVSYQMVAGARKEIASQYVIRDDRRVGFELGDYDRSRELVIDPVLRYSTYLGGSGHDIAMGIAVDGTGAVYLTGETLSARFPSRTALRGPQGTDGNYDNAYLTKLNSTGDAVLYNAYLGGSESDAGLSLGLGKDGSAFLSGITYSTNFPTTATAWQPSSKTLNGPSAFVSQVAPSGSGLAFSSYLAGSRTDFALGVAIDDQNNIYLTGRTESSDFPLTGHWTLGYQGNGDAFVAKIDGESMDLVYSFAFGGSGSDYGWGIAVDHSGCAYVTGRTTSTDFLTAGAMQGSNAGGNSDAFVVKVDPAGTSLLFGTYLGGSGDDQGLGIALDSQGNVFVTGSTTSIDFPVVNAIQPTLVNGKIARDAFLTKLDATGMKIAYSTYIGGSGDDLAQSVVVDKGGNAYISGITSSVDFPITTGAYQPANSGSFDAFVTALYPDGSPLLYSTFIGGKGEDAAVALAVDREDNVYVTGRTNSIDFPTTRGTFQARNAGGQDAFLLKISSIVQ